MVVLQKIGGKEIEREWALSNVLKQPIQTIGNFDLYEYCHLSGQVVRRMRDQYFPRYHLDTQKECEEFVGALKSLLEHVPLTVDVSALLERWRWFGE